MNKFRPPTLNVGNFINNKDGLLGSQNKSPFWKPKNDQSQIRFLSPNPPLPNGSFFVNVSSHYFNGSYFYCNKAIASNNGQDAKCAFCDSWANIYQQAQAEGRDRKTLTQAERYLVKQFSMQRRYASPVIVRGEEERGVVWYAYGKKMLDKLWQILSMKNTTNGELVYGNFFDWQTGYDFVVVKQMLEGFPDYGSSMIINQSTPVGTDEQMQFWYENMPNIFDKLTTISYKETMKIIQTPIAPVQQNNTMPINSTFTPQTTSPFTQPAMQQPAMQQPAMQQPAMQQPAMQQPAMQQLNPVDFNSLIAQVNITDQNAMEALTNWQNDGADDIERLHEIVAQYPKAAEQIPTTTVANPQQLMSELNKTIEQQNPNIDQQNSDDDDLPF